ncbi:MAG: hypothetical protein UY04_C0054G0006 [Parcubacteria group bacterium GW2011_GWA2_47_7]|nr:MAG: hypothetical protein UY04_C0054G0006 [Parcubacteria group bacterium GW2011_GWA2_47_7]
MDACVRVDKFHNPGQHEVNGPVALAALDQDGSGIKCHRGAVEQHAQFVLGHLGEVVAQVGVGRGLGIVPLRGDEQIRGAKRTGGADFALGVREWQGRMADDDLAGFIGGKVLGLAVDEPAAAVDFLEVRGFVVQGFHVFKILF